MGLPVFNALESISCEMLLLVRSFTCCLSHRISNRTLHVFVSGSSACCVFVVFDECRNITMQASFSCRRGLCINLAYFLFLTVADAHVPPSNGVHAYMRVFLSLCVCACVRACLLACARACVHVCMRACASMCAACVCVCVCVRAHSSIEPCARVHVCMRKFVCLGVRACMRA